MTKLLGELFSRAPQTLLSLALTATLSVAAARTQEIIRAYSGAQGDRLGYAVAVADIDRDGFGDIIATGIEETSPPGSGYAVVYSGSTGEVMVAKATRNTPSPRPMRWRPIGSRSGYSVSTGDVDGDGYQDILVGVPVFQSGRWHGGVRIYSGFTGLELPPVSLPNSDIGGGALVSLDVDRDGLADIVTAGLTPGAGQFYVFSAANRTTPLVHVGGSEFEDRFGTAIAVGSDEDGDDVPELFVSAPADTGSRQGSGSYVHVISVGPRGRTTNGGATIRRTLRGRGFDCFGYHLAAISDRDNDGLKDILVGAPANWRTVDNAAVYIVSSATGQVLLTVRGSASDSVRAGLALANLGDWNGDGIDDFITRREVHSGADGSVIYAIDPRRLIGRLGFGHNHGNFGGYANVGDLDQDGQPDLLAMDGTPAGDIYLLSLAANTRTRGVGCGGFTLAYENLPRIGSVLRMNLTNGFAGGIGYGFLAPGLREASLDLSAIAPGCWWHVQGVLFDTQAFTGTRATLQLPIPRIPEFHGVRLFTQALALDSARQAIRSSNRADFRIGL